MKEKLNLTTLSQKELKTVQGLGSCNCRCIIPPDGSDYDNVAFFQIKV